MLKCKACGYTKFLYGRYCDNCGRDINSNGKIFTLSQLKAKCKQLNIILEDNGGEYTIYAPKGQIFNATDLNFCIGDYSSNVINGGSKTFAVQNMMRDITNGMRKI